MLMCLYVTQYRAVRHDVSRLSIVHREVTKCIRSTVRDVYDTSRAIDYQNIIIYCLERVSATLHP
jgi:hypothetical protein